MLKYTYQKILASIIISIICITLHISGIPGNAWNSMKKFFSSPEIIEYTVYSDMPLDVVHQTTFYGWDVNENGEKVSVNFVANPNKDIIDTDYPIFVNDYIPYQGMYENKDVVGYYSLAFVADEKLLESIGEKVSNKSGYGTTIINFGDILNGFMLGETYSEVCNGPDKPIKIKAVYNSEDDIAYKLLESQVLYELTGNALQTEDNFEENREIIDGAIDKIEKYTGNFEKDTIYVVCEQSSAFSQLLGSGRPCYEYSMACEPFYMLYNGDRWKESKERMVNDTNNRGNFRNISYSTSMRTPLDGNHSNLVQSRYYRNAYSLDTVLKILRSTD